MASESRINRRRFLVAAAGAGSAALLAACGNDTPPAAPAVGGSSGSSGGAAATSAPRPTTAGATTAPGGSAATTAPMTSGMAGGTAGSGGKVFILVDKGVTDAGLLDATTLYNMNTKNMPGVELEDATAGMWEAKVLPQIKDKSLRWSGEGYIPYFDKYKEVKAGIVAPLDELIAKSSVPWLKNMKEAYISPRIYDAPVMEGKRYYLPMRLHPHLAGWRQDYIEMAGYPTMPKTWDEVNQMLPKLKKATEKDQVVPISIARDLWRIIGTTFATMLDDYTDEQGVFRLESPEWLATMEMFKNWMDNGYARFDIQDDAINLWQKGKFAMSLGSHSWVRLGRAVYGPDKVKGGVPPQPNATQKPRTWVHIDSFCVFNGAPNPQGALDWAATAYGPEGPAAEAWWKTTLGVSGMPPYQPMIDKFIKTNKDISEMNDILAILPNSRVNTAPQTNGYNTMQTVIPPTFDRYFKGEFSSAKDAAAAIRKGVNDELAKQKA